VEKLKKKNFSSDDAMIVDVGDHVFVWVGKGASTNERLKAHQYASDYLHLHNRPGWIPIIQVYEGKIEKKKFQY